MNNNVKAVALAVALGLGLSAVVPSVEAASPSAADNLVASLKALKVDQVDYLYTYLQSVNLTDAEYNQILANVDSFKNVIGSTTNTSQLTNAQKAEASRLFLDSAQLAHLQVAFVDNAGNKISLSNYQAGAGLKVQLLDLKGNLLASIKPTNADLNAATLSTMISSLTTAVEAKKELEQSGTFVPMPNGDLPNTNTQDPAYMALGALLILLGGIAVVPAVKAFRKEDEPLQA